MRPIAALPGSKWGRGVGLNKCRGLEGVACGGERSTGEGLKAKDAVPPKSSGPKRVPAPLMGRQKPPRAQEGLACPTSPRRPIRPVRRQKLRARGRVERDRFFLSLYSQGNHHSINFVVTHLSIKTAPPPLQKKSLL